MEGEWAECWSDNHMSTYLGCTPWAGTEYDLVFEDMGFALRKT